MPSPTTPHRKRIPLAPPHGDSGIAHARAWQSHLDAGRIGTRAPAPAHVAANRARTEALFGNTALGRSFSLNREGC
jgi:hypothetical protein